MTLRATNTVHREEGDSRFAGQRVWFWCSGCNTHHAFTTRLADGEEGPVWDWNGDLERPTFNPSLLCNGNAKPKDLHPHTSSHRCHLYLRDGMVQYLNDCTHELRGKTIPVEDPRW